MREQQVVVLASAANKLRQRPVCWKPTGRPVRMKLHFKTEFQRQKVLSRNSICVNGWK